MTATSVSPPSPYSRRRPSSIVRRALAVSSSMAMWTRLAILKVEPTRPESAMSVRIVETWLAKSELW